MLDLMKVLVELLASVAPVDSQGVIVRTDLAYLSWQLGRKAVVYIKKNSKRTGVSCSGERIEPIVVFLSG